MNENETLDDLLGGKLKILQKKKGYRFSIDSILLAHFVRLRPGMKAVELGLGSGVISLILCYRTGCSLTGVELQPQMADMAARSFRLNSLEGKIDIVKGDVRDIKKIMPGGQFDAVIFNPPYRRKGSGRISADAEKAIARHEINGSLADFISASEFLLKKHGEVFTIYPASRGVELVCRMRDSGIEPKTMRIVHSAARTEAEFILLEGSKGGGEELQILPPLFIYDSEGNYTPEIQAIFSELSLRPSSCGG
jgi:tRNA1Val (adenine37-N6)-methyltransferase